MTTATKTLPELITEWRAHADAAWDAGNLKQYFRELDTARARVAKAIARGRITPDDAQAAWSAGQVGERTKSRIDLPAY